MGTAVLSKHLTKHWQRGVGLRWPHSHESAPGPYLWLPTNIEGDWGKLLEQVDALALWASEKEKEVLWSERATEWWERSGQERNKHQRRREQLSWR